MLYYFHYSVENDYSPSQPTLEEDEQQSYHQQEISHRNNNKSSQQHQHSPENRPPPPSDRALKKRQQAFSQHIYIDSYITRIVDNDLLLDDCTNFESASRRMSSCTDSLFSQDLRLLIEEQEVPPFVLSGKTFRRDGLSTNATFMWTLICSLKYECNRKEDQRRHRGSYERSLLKQFRRQADYRVIYSGESLTHHSSAPPSNSRQLDNFLNSEYHSLIGIKTKQFNDYIPKDKHKYYPLSKRVINLLMSLPSSQDIEKVGCEDMESSQSNDKGGKSGRYGIPLIDKNKRRQLASREERKINSTSSVCIEIEDDEEDSSKLYYDRNRRGYIDKQTYSSNNNNSPNRSKYSEKNNSYTSSKEEKRISEDKSATDRIAELKKMLPMIGKKPKKPVKSVKALLEMSRSKNSVPHKPGPYQPLKVSSTLEPISKSVAQITNKPKVENIEMQISDESDHNEDAQPKSRGNPPHPPLPPTTTIDTIKELPPLPPSPTNAIEKLPNPLADPIVNQIEVEKEDGNIIHSIIVKKQLKQMEAFLNRGSSDEIIQPQPVVSEVMSSSIQSEQIYNYPYPPVDNSYNQNLTNVAPYAAYPSQTEDYWNNYYAQQQPIANTNTMEFTVPPPALASDVPPITVNTNLPPPSLDGVMPNLNTSVPPPPPPPPAFDTSLPPPSFDHSMPAVIFPDPYQSIDYATDQNAMFSDEVTYEQCEFYEGDSLDNISDIEWYESEHVDTCEYSGIEPPIPGLQKEILPPLPGIKSTYSSTDTPFVSHLLFLLHR